jgi:hypothetical protein
MFQKQASRPLFWGLVTLGALSCVPVMAQQSGTPAPLRQPSPLEAVDQARWGMMQKAHFSLTVTKLEFNAAPRNLKRFI